jgi:putative phage-type endonuclease
MKRQRDLQEEEDRAVEEVRVKKKEGWAEEEGIEKWMADVLVLEMWYEEAKAKFQGRICDNPLNVNVEWDMLPMDLKTLLIYKGPEQQTPEWEEVRRLQRIVNASDVSVIAHGYIQFGFIIKSARHVFERIVGLAPREPGNPATLHGQKNESRAAMLYAQKTGYVLFDKFPSIPHPLIPWMAASPDRIAYDPRTCKVINVEIKCPLNRQVTQESIRNVEAVKQNYLHYYDQMQQQMMCFGLKETHFVMCGFPPNSNHPTEKDIAFAMCRIPYDQEWWPSICLRVVSFADAVFHYRGQVPPAIDLSLVA